MFGKTKETIDTPDVRREIINELGSDSIQIVIEISCLTQVHIHPA